MLSSSYLLKTANDYAEAGIVCGLTHHDGYFVLRENRFIASFQTREQQAIFAEELYERIKFVRASVSASASQD